MRALTIASILALTAVAGIGQAEAKGCLKGAVVGGVAGHMVGHGRGGRCGGLRRRPPPRQQGEHEHRADLDRLHHHDHSLRSNGTAAPDGRCRAFPHLATSSPRSAD